MRVQQWSMTRSTCQLEPGTAEMVDPADTRGGGRTPLVTHVTTGPTSRRFTYRAGVRSKDGAAGSGPLDMLPTTC
jgi:hypothetical protein